MSENSLTAQAEALGIKVDGRWSDARIQQEIDKVSDKPEPVEPEPVAKPATVMVRINRDIWVDNPDDPAEPLRYRKGTIKEVTIEQAFDGIESGALSRVK